MSTQIIPLSRGESLQTMCTLPFDALPGNSTMLDRVYIGFKERYTLRGWDRWVGVETLENFELLFLRGTVKTSQYIGINEHVLWFEGAYWDFFTELYRGANWLIAYAGYPYPAWRASVRHAKNWDGIADPDFFYGDGDYAEASTTKWEIVNYWMFENIQDAFKIFDDNYVP